jgi:hypothetical protein
VVVYAGPFLNSIESYDRLLIALQKNTISGILTPEHSLHCMTSITAVFGKETRSRNSTVWTTTRIRTYLNQNVMRSSMEF